jgi:hypothetical protein
MPSERRLIRFAPPEVEAALRQFAEEQERALPGNRVTSIEYDAQGTEGVGARVSFQDIARPTHFTALELAAALIAYCRKVQVPIPKQGQKSLHKSTAGLFLQIDVPSK